MKKKKKLIILCIALLLFVGSVIYCWPSSFDKHFYSNDPELMRTSILVDFGRESSLYNLSSHPEESQEFISIFDQYRYRRTLMSAFPAKMIPSSGATIMIFFSDQENGTRNSIELTGVKNSELYFNNHPHIMEDGAMDLMNDIFSFLNENIHLLQVD